MTRKTLSVTIVAIAITFCATSLYAADQSAGGVGFQAVTASRGVGQGQFAESRRSPGQPTESIEVGRDPHASLMEWLESVGVGHDGVLFAPGEGERSDAAPGAEEVPGLVGGNLPICTYADDVSQTESLNMSSLAYNFNFPQYMVVWQGLSRNTYFDIFGRLTSPSGTNPSSIFTITSADGLQSAPHVAYESLMVQYFVTWSDFGSGLTGAIRMRRYSTTAAALGNPITVNTSSNSSYGGRVACGGGHCVVVWMNDPFDGNVHVMARTYDTQGNPMTAPVMLSDAIGTAANPDIAYDSKTGNFLVVWEQKVSGWRDIKGVGVNYPLSSQQRITISTALGDQVYPRVAYSAGASGYLVVWQDGRAPKWDVWGQRVAGSFSLLGSELNIFNGPYNEYSPVVSGLDTTAQFAVVYATDTNGGGLLQIHAKEVDGNGGVGGIIAVREWNNQRNKPAIAAQILGNTYLVTLTDLGSGTTSDILGQVITSAGQLSGSLLAIARGRKGQELPAIVYDSVHNEYLVVWMDYRFGFDYQIWGRRVAASGAVIGNEFPIGNESTSILYGNPSVAYNPTSDEFLVVWQEIHNQATGYDIYARRVRWDGNLPAAAFHVSRDSGAFNEGTASVAYNSAANEFLVVWGAFDDTNSKLWRDWGQRVSAAGTLSGSGFVVTSSNGDCRLPRVTANSAGNSYLVIWEDLRDRGDGLFGQRVNGSGSLAGVNFPISINTGYKTGYDLVWGPSGNDYLVVWGDTRSGSSIYGQRIDGNGTVVGTDIPIANTSLYERSPAIAYDTKNQGFVVTWQQPGETTDVDIWARSVPKTGTPSDTSLALCTALDIQYVPQIAHNSASGQFLIVWQDFRSTSYDVYGQLIGSCSVTCTANVPSTGMVGASVAFTSTGNATGCSGSVTYDWDFGDGSARQTTQNPNHTYSAAKAYNWSLIVSSGGATCAKSGTITIAGVSNCSVTCSASVPLMGSINVPLTFSGSAVVSGCTSPVSYDWDFGDNSVHGTTQDVNHTYTLAGTYNWKVLATAGNGTAWRNGTVVISGTSKIFIPVVSHAGGYVGGWRSDVGILNRSTTKSANVAMTLRTSTRSYTGNVTVLAKGQEILRDAAGLLNLESGSGSLELDSDQPVIVTSRTYNLQDSGWTYGQGYDGVALTDGISTGQSAWLPQLTQNGVSGQVGTYRTNIGIANIGTTTAKITLILYDSLGNEVWTNIRDIGPGVWYQYGEPYRVYALRNNIVKGCAKIIVNSGSNVVAVASVVDNGSSDPTTIMMRRTDKVSLAIPDVWWVPVISHSGGIIGGWRSDLGVLNRSSSAVARVALTLRTITNTYTGNITVQAKGQEILLDAAMLLNLSSGSGSLELSSDQPIIVSSRTYNLQDNGWTYGQGYDGMAISDGLAAGQSAFLPQLTQNGVSGQAGTYRSNIGVTNLGTTTANITLVLYDSVGNELLTHTRDIGPGLWIQYQEPFRISALRNDIAKGYAKITVNSGSSVIAYASLVDNGSSDPTTMMMRR